MGRSNHSRLFFHRLLCAALGSSLSIVSFASAQEAPSQPPSIDDPEGLVEDDSSLNKLAIPQHPERKAPDAKNSLPKESQKDRDSRKSYLTQSRRTADRYMPGHPSRNLGLPSTVEEANAPESEEEKAPEPILWFLPHELRGGGVTFECIYTGETFTKAKGGMTPGRPTNYRSNLDLVAIADTGKLGWWDRGRFFVYGQNLSGRPLSVNDVGDYQLFSNLDSTLGPDHRPQFTAVSEYWFEQVLFDDKFRFRLGKQDSNTIFVLTDLGGEFVHSSFGAPPLIPMPTFPSNALGLSCFYQVAEPLTFGVGLYDGSLPPGPQGVRWGFDTLGHNGLFSIYQAEYKPQLGADGELPTTIRTGMWHHSDKTVWTEITSDPNPITYRQNYGCFFTMDQMLWKENGAEDDQGLGAFFQFFGVPGNRNPASQYLGTGLVYKGFLPGRDADYIGCGLAQVVFSDSYQAQQFDLGTEIGNSETAIETFYKYMVTPVFVLQPDIQYIANPSGQYRDAIVAGLRFEGVF